jgi:hypothetical protein
MVSMELVLLGGNTSKENTVLSGLKIDAIFIK